MGVSWEDCPVVAELLGTKLFLNEFVAYEALSQYKNRRLAGAEEWIGTKKQWISVSVRSPPEAGARPSFSSCSLGPRRRQASQPSPWDPRRLGYGEGALLEMWEIWL